MADSKLIDVTEDTTPALTDFLYGVDSTGATDKRVSVANLLTLNAGTLVGLTCYDPATGVAYTTTTTLADVDATNAKVDFVVPPSGVVLVTLTCQAYPNASTGTLFWGLRESTTTVKEAMVASDFSTFDVVTLSRDFRVSGLTPGASKTYKFAARHTVNTWDLRYGDPGAASPLGAISMKVEAAF